MTNPIKIKVGIIGGAGYTGGELIRLLLNHPFAEIVFVHSNSNAGNKISHVHKDLLGDTDLIFSNTVLQEIDVLFLCVGHGDAKKFLANNFIKPAIKIIDLSQDFRLDSNSQFQERQFTYGLVELNKEQIKNSQNIANPGCFATAIQLGLLPLITKQLIENDVHTSGITGSTGAGQSLTQSSHFSWRNNNLSSYKVLTHQHLNEIYQTIGHFQKASAPKVNFVPYRGNFTRGILITSYFQTNLSKVAAKEIFETYYAQDSFTHLSETEIDLKLVVNTNKCMIHIEKVEDNLIITSAIDNLLKGASGQAVQNMNLMFGIEETTGLKLKPSAF
jgi:N-acetyl-gamma-glutamyl-phosphate reductase